MTFHVGQKVVCVDASNPKSPGEDPIKEGEIYTIELIENDVEGCFVDLVEMQKLPLTPGRYLARRFRSAVERKIDISIFTAMLTPNKQKAMT